MNYNETLILLKAKPRKWLVTGAAGFIGSHLVETLLESNQSVVALDNLSTGHIKNIQKFTEEYPQNFNFIQGDILDLETCSKAMVDTEHVLHQAALGSVPRSIENPLNTHKSNVNGHLNVLISAKEKGVKSFVYASSSSVYGDHPDLPKQESKIGNCLSPYAASKRINEIYSEVFQRCYDLQVAGLRYFNVFGPRQDPNGPYAAVIPKWVSAFLAGEQIEIYGDGETSRDFCYVKNVVQANILLSLSQNKKAFGETYNIAFNKRTTLNELFEQLTIGLKTRGQLIKNKEPIYKDFRKGDVRHSLADIDKAKKLFKYEPDYSLEMGLNESLDWYIKNSQRRQ